MKVEIGRFVFASFDKGDWQKSPGCSKLPDGREPLVCYLGDESLFIEGSRVNPTEYSLTLRHAGDPTQDIVATFRTFDDLCEMCNFLFRLNRR